MSVDYILNSASKYNYIHQNIRFFTPITFSWQKLLTSVIFIQAHILTIRKWFNCQYIKLLFTNSQISSSINNWFYYKQMHIYIYIYIKGLFASQCPYSHQRTPIGWANELEQVRANDANKSTYTLLKESMTSKKFGQKLLNFEQQ